jgi:hypothetical protein
VACVCEVAVNQSRTRISISSHRIALPRVGLIYSAIRADSAGEDGAAVSMVSVLPHKAVTATWHIVAGQVNGCPLIFFRDTTRASGACHNAHHVYTR